MSSSRLVIVALLFAFSAVSYFDRTIMSIAGPALIDEFHVSATEMGSVYSAFILGYALLMIPGGWLTDRLGPRRTLLIMGASSAALTGMTVIGGRPGLGSLIGVVPAMFLIRLVLGFVTAPLYPACARATANWIPLTQHARVQGFIIAGSSVGAAVSPVIFVWLMSRLGWRGAFAAAAIVTAALTGLWYMHARDYPAEAQAERSHPVTARGARIWSELFRDRNLQLITFAYAGLGYFQYIFFYWIYYYFGQVRHLDASESAGYTTILFVTEGIMMPLGGLISDRITRAHGPQLGRRVVPMVGLTLSAVCTYLGVISAGTVAVVFFLSLAFGFAACCEGPFWAFLTDTAGESVGAASSILNLGAQIGGFFSPIVTPYIAARLGWSWGLYVGSLFAILGVIALYFVRLQRSGLVADSAAVKCGSVV
jgi:ACS family glucarate transporter-like MFS transporter